MSADVIDDIVDSGAGCAGRAVEQAPGEKRSDQMRLQGPGVGQVSGAMVSLFNEAGKRPDRYHGRTRGMGGVALHDDFVLLTGGHAVSPSLKIAVRFGRWDLEMNGVQEVKVEYDPKIDAARLMMPESESPYHVPSKYDPPEPPMIPFFSRDRVDVTRFWFAPRVEGETLIFLCGNDDYSARLKLEGLERLPIPAAKKNPAALLHLILQTIGRLRAWPDDLPGLSAIRRIEIRIGSKFVEALERKSGLTLPTAVPGESLIAQWELGQ